jgi:hypothetical protein
MESDPTDRPCQVEGVSSEDDDADDYEKKKKKKKKKALTIVFIKSFDQSSHLKVPHLNTTRVKGSSQEGQLGMEGYPLDPIGFGLELMMIIVMWDQF